MMLHYAIRLNAFVSCQVFLMEKRVSEVTKATALYSSIYFPLLLNEWMVLPTGHNTPATPGPIAIDGKRWVKKRPVPGNEGRCGKKPNYKCARTISAADMYSKHCGLLFAYFR